MSLLLHRHHHHQHRCTSWTSIYLPTTITLCNQAILPHSSSHMPYKDSLALFSLVTTCPTQPAPTTDIAADARHNCNSKHAVSASAICLHHLTNIDLPPTSSNTSNHYTISLSG